ncbi:MAG: SPFH domain-containing protein [Methylococcales bacterium]|nr:SPFH domain-containing protein [Methylococcales bacterium]
MQKISFIFFVLTLITACTNPRTPAGHEGYVYESPRLFGHGGFKESMLGPSNYGFSFFRNEVINIDMRPTTYREQFKILAQDDLNVTVGVHAVLSLEQNSIKKVVEDYGGENSYIRFVQKSFRTYVRNAIQPYTSKEIKQKRDFIAKKLKIKLEGYLTKSPFKVHSVVVGNIDYPPIVVEAIEKKLVAEQLLAEKEIQKAIAIKDAEIRVEEAKGIAAAQEIINKTLTANYLQHEAINAQLKMAESPNHTTVYIPSGTNGIPLVSTVNR